MLAILAHPGDVAALWAAEGLKARGLHPVELFDADELARAKRWEHRLGQGGAYVAATLPDGSVFDSRKLTGTLNRLIELPRGPIAGASAEDREYASQELHAFWLSWLKALPGPVINPPDPRGLGGALRSSTEWTALAARAGLPVRTEVFRSSVQHDDPNEWTLPSVTMVVLNGEVFGPLADRLVRSGCQRLRALAGTPLLGIRFVRTERGWQFSSATPLPDLRSGGTPLLDALASALS
jgi:hypothetical protein